jgi:hypothetical protein
MLTIVTCFKQWWHYLEGTVKPITVYMDHKNLEYFATARQLNRRQARWAEILIRKNDSVCPIRLGGAGSQSGQSVAGGPGGGPNAWALLHRLGLNPKRRR